MNPALLVPLIQGIIAAAPSIVEAVKAVKDFLAALFGAKLITQAQQDALHAYVDSCQALALNGAIPDHWKVEADPA